MRSPTTITESLMVTSLVVVVLAEIVVVFPEPSTVRLPSTLSGCRIASSPPINGFWIVSESLKTTVWVPPAVPMRMSLADVGPPTTISPKPSCR